MEELARLHSNLSGLYIPDHDALSQSVWVYAETKNRNDMSLTGPQNLGQFLRNGSLVSWSVTRLPTRFVLMGCADRPLEALHELVLMDPSRAIPLQAAHFPTYYVEYVTWVISTPDHMARHMRVYL